jgi:hypothetical protein
MFGSIYAKVAAVMIVVSATECFGLSLIRNGSFEADGPIADIKAVSPQFWDVNAPTNFGGDVSGPALSDGFYALGLFASGAFTAGQEAFVSQKQVDCSDANEIILDLYLASYKYGLEYPWDGTKCTAFVKIDDDVVWESNSTATGPDNVIIPVASYKDSQLHTLTLGMKVIADGTLPRAQWAIWDSVRFDAYCEGGGYLSGDINHDCYVDMADMGFMADDWLDANMPAGLHRADIAWDGTINLADFALLAEQWMDCTDWAGAACEPLEPYLGYDLNEDGIVDFTDYALMMAGESDMTDIGYLADQWLQRTWLYDVLNESEGGGSPL